MSRKKILILGPLSSQHIQMWYRHLDTRQYDVTVMTIHNGGEAMDDKVKIIDVSVFKSRLDFIILAVFFFFYALITRPALINFHFLSSYGLLALLTQNKNKILSTWGTDVNGIGCSGVKRWLIKKALKRYKWINTPAQHMKKKLTQLGAEPERIEVYQYGIELGESAPKNVAASDAQNKPVKIVSNRNWGPIYNIDAIVQGFSLWLEKNNSVSAELLLYGSGDDSSRKKVMSLIDSSPVNNQIKICGYTPKKEMLEQMTNANIFISIPNTDGTPLSLLEAINIGLLPIVSDIDANREWLNSEQAIFVQELTPEHVCQALQEAFSRLGSDEHRQKLRDAKTVVAQNANYHTNTQRFYDKINALIKASASK